MAENLVFEFRINGINGAINNVDQLKDAVKATTQAFNQTKEGTQEYERLKKTLGGLKAVQKGIRDDIRKEQRAFEASTKFAKGSYRQLNATLVQLRNQYKELSAAQRKTQGKALIKDIQRLDKELKKLDAGIGLFQRNVGNYQKAFQGLGKFFAGGLLLGAVVKVARGIGDITKQMFNLAIQTDTLQGKNLTVLGAAFEDVSARANEVAADLGLSTQQYINQAAAISDVLKPIGFLDTEAAGLSTQLVDLSGALAEWSGGTRTAEEAADTLTKALVGEREQLKQYGIVLQEADITARLAAKGQDELTGNALKQAKAVATLELVMESSTDAQRSFAENSDSLVRTQSRLTALFQTVRETLATALIPVFGAALQAIEPVVRAFAESVPTAIQFLSTTFGPLADAVSELFSAFQDGATESNVLTQALRNFAVGGVRLVANVLTTLVSVVTAFVNSIGNARDETGAFRQEAGLITRVFTVIIETLGQLPAIVNGVVEVFKNGGEVITNFFNSLGLGIRIAFNDLKGLVSSEAQARAAELRAQRDQLRQEGDSIGKAFLRGYQDALKEVDTPEIKTPKANPNALRNQAKADANTYIDTFDTAANNDGPFQRLVNRQKELKDAIQDLRVQGQDYTKELEEYVTVTEQVNAVNALFKSSTDKSKEALDLQAGSIGLIKEELKTLNEELNAANPQKAIEIAEKIVEANKKLEEAQGSINAILAPDEATRAAIEKQIQEAEQATQQIKNIRISALQQQNLTEEQFAAARQQIELEAERDLANTKAGIYKDNAAERIASEVEAADAIIEIQRNLEQQRQEAFQETIARYQEGLGLFQGAADSLGEVLDNNTQARTNDIEARYAREIELAAGNSDEIARLEEERDQRVRAVQREAFERQKKLQALTATISYFQGIVNILSSPTTIPDPFGAIFKGLRVGFLTATYASNLNRIKSQRFAKRGALIEQIAATSRYMARGGMVQPQLGQVQGGKTHAQGGNHAIIHGQHVEYERGEFMDQDEDGNVVIVNRANTRRFRKQLYAMAKKRYMGKRQDLSTINSYLGAGVTFAQDGALIPNLGPNLASGGSTTVITNTTLSDEQFDRLEATLTRATRKGAQLGTTDGIETGTREQERQGRLETNITT